ncbi:hypothetical protein BGZ61DRAFT_486117 [Ilyonectria robusta]|uniref:uncharacterized protein n=1 Tax=Ilyonectria robusta TaxID=1079257 RepID=UPI001E8E85C6|nr:uncharacterized protein BGZ61DRAFT_486117 [Ilyonectria robusta]KAH8658936.1 hypothetical protein BGZ61DRAFT_486117 [Ilyonectria robusta]
MGHHWPDGFAPWCPDSLSSSSALLASSSSGSRRATSFWQPRLSSATVVSLPMIELHAVWPTEPGAARTRLLKSRPTKAAPFAPYLAPRSVSASRKHPDDLCTFQTWVLTLPPPLARDSYRPQPPNNPGLPMDTAAQAQEAETERWSFTRGGTPQRDPSRTPPRRQHQPRNGNIDSTPRRRHVLLAQSPQVNTRRAVPGPAPIIFDQVLDRAAIRHQHGGFMMAGREGAIGPISAEGAVGNLAREDRRDASLYCRDVYATPQTPTPWISTQMTCTAGCLEQPFHLVHCQPRRAAQPETSPLQEPTRTQSTICRFLISFFSRRHDFVLFCTSPYLFLNTAASLENIRPCAYASSSVIDAVARSFPYPAPLPMCTSPPLDYPASSTHGPKPGLLPLAIQRLAAERIYIMAAPPQDDIDKFMADAVASVHDKLQELGLDTTADPYTYQAYGLVSELRASVHESAGGQPKRNRAHRRVHDDNHDDILKQLPDAARPLMSGIMSPRLLLQGRRRVRKALENLVRKGKELHTVCGGHAGILFVLPLNVDQTLDVQPTHDILRLRLATAAHIGKQVAGLPWVGKHREREPVRQGLPRAHRPLGWFTELTTPQFRLMARARREESPTPVHRRPI